MGRARAGGGTRRVVVALVVLSTFGLVLGAGAVPGSPDPGYGSGGVASVPADPGRVAFPTQMVSTPSGAVWAILWEQVSGGGGSTDLSRLIRFAPDGSVVGSLDLSASVPPPPPGPFGTSPRLSSLAADGEDVYVTVTTAGATSESSLLRIRADLTPDPSFGGDGEIASESNELGVPLDPSCIGYCGLFWPMLAAGPDGSVYSVLLWSGVHAVVRVERLDAHRYEVALDDAVVGEPADANAAAEMVLATFNAVAASRQTDAVRLHAGAVSRDGRTVVICGRSGAGKSTAVAALVRAGWGYLTDEVAVIDPGTWQVTPYPKWLDLSPESLQRIGVSAADAVGPVGPKRHVPPAILGDLGPAGPVAVVVLLDGESTLSAPQPVSQSAALERVLPHVFATTWEGERGLQSAADLCSGVPVVEVPRCDTTTMVRWIGDLLP